MPTHNLIQEEEVLPSSDSQMEHIIIQIAEIAISVTTTDLTMAQRIRHRYHDFLQPTATPVVTISVIVKPGAVYIQPGPGTWIIETHYDSERLTYKSYTEYGELNLITGKGFVEMASDAHIENYLRVIYAWLCLNVGGLLMHASGVIRREVGYVFFGPSGAGKTTTSRLAAREAAVLSDDLVIIRKKDDQYYLYGVPFKGEMSDAPRANQCAPLQAIFRLRQDSRHYLEPMSRVIAVAEMAGSAPFINNVSALNDTLLATCNQIAQAISVQQLHFRRDDGFWKVIDEFFEPVPHATRTDSR